MPAAKKNKTKAKKAPPKHQMPRKGKTLDVARRAAKATARAKTNGVG